MAQSRWKFNEGGSIPDGGFYTRTPDTGDWRLEQKTTTASVGGTPWEGTGSVILDNGGYSRIRTAAYGFPTASIYWIDLMFFMPTGAAASVTGIGLCANESLSEYSWIEVSSSGGNYRIQGKAWDPWSSQVITTTTAVTAGPINNWARIRTVIGQKGAYQADIWTGAALPTDANGGNENATPTASTSTWAGTGFSNWEVVRPWNTTDGTGVLVDDVLFDLWSAPTRVPAVTEGTSFAGIVPI